TAAVCVQRVDGQQFREAACGDGPIDAVFRTLMRITGINAQLRDFQVRSVSQGEDAQGEATVEVEHLGRLYRGRATSTDIIEAGALAFLSVLNQIAWWEQARASSIPQTKSIPQP
ncbi:MAG: hypothetical protein NZM42_14885, partial [Gemmatales bacterium]|nr:hypothetical protein [Gemmatales bacterium]